MNSAFGILKKNDYASVRKRKKTQVVNAKVIRQRLNLILQSCGDERTKRGFSQCKSEKEKREMYDSISASSMQLEKKTSQDDLFKLRNTQTTITSIAGIAWSYFKIEMYRLVTFAKYPVKANLSALVLAADGFVYTGTGVDNDDTVVCYFCCKSKDKWQINEKVEDTHKEIWPNCCMVTKLNCDNVPLISPVPVGSSFTEAINSLDSAPRASQEVKRIPLSTNSLHNSNDIETECAPHQSSVVSNPESSFRGLTQSRTTSASTTVQPNPDPSVSRSSGQLVKNVEPSSTVSLIPSTVDNNSQVITAPTPALKHTLSIVPNIPPPSLCDDGIITERPKRPEYVKKEERAKTFTAWPRDHHLTVPELVDAGFYYAGYGDCTRCFSCDGGIRNWEDEHDVFVEHARCFPQCAFIRQLMGQALVDMVQELNKTLDKIPYKLVKSKINAPEKNVQLDTNDEPIKRDPAVRAVMEIGYKENDVVESAKFVKKREEKRKVNNTEPRQQTVCKICMDKDVAVVFLPCGHLASCTDCAASLDKCPICRNPVKGIVRAFIG